MASAEDGEAVLSSYDDAPPAVFRDGLDDVGGQTILPPDRDQRLVAQAHEAVSGGPDPEATFLVDQQTAGWPSDRFAAGRGHLHETVLNPTVHAAYGSYPRSAIWRIEDRVDTHRDAFGPAVVGDGAVLQADHHAVLGADPQRAAWNPSKRMQPPTLAAGEGVVDHEAAVGEAMELTARGHDDARRRGGAQGHAAAAQAVFLGVGREGSVGEAADARGSADPQAPVLGDIQGGDRVAQQTVVSRVALESAILERGNASRDSTDPQDAVAILDELRQLAIVDLSRLGSEDGEADAVETDQADLGGHPDMAVLRLNDSPDGGLRQALRLAPGVDPVLVKEGHPRSPRRRRTVTSGRRCRPGAVQGARPRPEICLRDRSETPRSRRPR